MLTPSFSSAIATVRSDAVRAMFFALGSVFSMGLNRFTTRVVSSSWEIRFLGLAEPWQAARDSAASAARNRADHFRLTLLIGVMIHLPFAWYIAQ